MWVGEYMENYICERGARVELSGEKVACDARFAERPPTMNQR